MNAVEPNAALSGPQSFVIKLWVEQQGDVDKVEWRGQITHVPSGARQYVTSLREISEFIERYLGLLGVRQARRGIVKRWFNR